MTSKGTPRRLIGTEPFTPERLRRDEESARWWDARWVFLPCLVVAAGAGLVLRSARVFVVGFLLGPVLSTAATVRDGATPGMRRRGLAVVRRGTGGPAGWWRPPLGMALLMAPAAGYVIVGLGPGRWPWWIGLPVVQLGVLVVSIKRGGWNVAPNLAAVGLDVWWDPRSFPAGP